MKRILVILFWLIVAILFFRQATRAFGQGPPIKRNYYTTNQNPVLTSANGAFISIMNSTSPPVFKTFSDPGGMLVDQATNIVFTGASNASGFILSQDGRGTNTSFFAGTATSIPIKAFGAIGQRSNLVEAADSNSVVRFVVASNGWTGIRTSAPQAALHFGPAIASGSQPLTGIRIDPPNGDLNGSGPIWLDVYTSSNNAPNARPNIISRWGYNPQASFSDARLFLTQESHYNGGTGESNTQFETYLQWHGTNGQSGRPWGIAARKYVNAPLTYPFFRHDSLVSEAYIFDAYGQNQGLFYQPSGTNSGDGFEWNYAGGLTLTEGGVGARDLIVRPITNANMRIVAASDWTAGGANQNLIYLLAANTGHYLQSRVIGTNVPTPIYSAVEGNIGWIMATNGHMTFPNGFDFPLLTNLTVYGTIRFPDLPLFLGTNGDEIDWNPGNSQLNLHNQSSITTNLWINDTERINNIFFGSAPNIQIRSSLATGTTNLTLNLNDGIDQLNGAYRLSASPGPTRMEFGTATELRLDGNARIVFSSASTNFPPSTNGLPGQQLTTDGGNPAQLYWSTDTNGGTVVTSDVATVWTNDLLNVRSTTAFSELDSTNNSPVSFSRNGSNVFRSWPVDVKIGSTAPNIGPDQHVSSYRGLNCFIIHTSAYFYRDSATNFTIVPLTNYLGTTPTTWQLCTNASGQTNLVVVTSQTNINEYNLTHFTSGTLLPTNATQVTNFISFTTNSYATHSIQMTNLGIAFMSSVSMGGGANALVYRYPNGTYTNHGTFSFTNTFPSAHTGTIVQHPTTGKLWLLDIGDGSATIDLAVFSASGNGGNGITFDSYSTNYISAVPIGPRDGHASPYGELPDIAALSNPIDGNILLAYPGYYGDVAFQPHLVLVSVSTTNQGSAILLFESTADDPAERIVANAQITRTTNHIFLTWKENSEYTNTSRIFLRVISSTNTSDFYSFFPQTAFAADNANLHIGRGDAFDRVCQHFLFNGSAFTTTHFMRMYDWPPATDWNVFSTRIAGIDSFGKLQSRAADIGPRETLTNGYVLRVHHHQTNQFMVDNTGAAIVSGTTPQLVITNTAGFSGDISVITDELKIKTLGLSLDAFVNGGFIVQQRLPATNQYVLKVADKLGNTMASVVTNSGYGGGGTKALFDDGTYKSVGSSLVMNQTDRFIPLRSNSTDFADSVLVQRGSNLYVTNILGDLDLIYFQNSQANGLMNIGLNTGGTGAMNANGNININAIGGTLTLSTSTKDWVFTGTTLSLGESNTFNLGTLTGPFASLKLATNSPVYWGTNVLVATTAGLIFNGVLITSGTGSAQDAGFTNNGTITYPFASGSEGAIVITNGTSAGFSMLDAGTGPILHVFGDTGSGSIVANGSKDLRLGANGGVKWRIDSATGDLVPDSAGLNVGQSGSPINILYATGVETLGSDHDGFVDLIGTNTHSITRLTINPDETITNHIYLDIGPGAFAGDGLVIHSVTTATTTNKIVLTNQVAQLAAAASVMTFDRRFTQMLMQTNRMTAAETLVLTNFTAGQVGTAIIPGEASGGTDRNLVLAVAAGDLIRLNGAAPVASLTLVNTNGQEWEINVLKKSFRSTNYWDLRTSFNVQ